VDAAAALVIVNLVLTLVLVALVVVLIGRVRASATTKADAPALDAVVREELRRSASELRDDLTRQRGELTDALTRLRMENQQQLDQVRESVGEKLQTTLSTSLAENAERIQALTKANGDKQAELQTTLREELDKLRQGNEAKLEKMRETVDEKLQGTLEKRLGESFALVSERLEFVQRGLGEMQALATDVGGLKRVLTNVKNRGGWGEVQLSRQLEDLLTREQYEENVAVKPGSAERVEFAVRMPGGDEPVYLAIDSKFPQEDYERLLDAQEGGDKVAIDDAGRALERAMLEQAKTISSKYIAAPHTTDFAILYLPTEGLFAEVMRRPGLAGRIQRELHVMVTGPTTLMSLLNALQMGFRTLAIEQRSSEVWKVLGAAKAEFEKYGLVWEKLKKQLATAQNTVDEAGTRTRALSRKLRDVESLDALPSSGDAAGALLEELGSVDGMAGVGRPEIDESLVTPTLLDADETDEGATA
jgi:DNA recombination protein RmuC